MRLVNFGHRELLTVGAYAGLVVKVHLAPQFVLGLVAALGASSGFAVGSEWRAANPIDGPARPSAGPGDQ